MHRAGPACVRNAQQVCPIGLLSFARPLRREPKAATRCRRLEYSTVVPSFGCSKKKECRDDCEKWLASRARSGAWRRAGGVGRTGSPRRMTSAPSKARARKSARDAASMRWTVSSFAATAATTTTAIAIAVTGYYYGAYDSHRRERLRTPRDGITGRTGTNLTAYSTLTTCIACAFKERQLQPAALSLLRRLLLAGALRSFDLGASALEAP